MVVTIKHMKMSSAVLKALSALHGVEYELNSFIPKMENENLKDEFLEFRTHLFKEYSWFEEINRELMKARLKEEV